jgi:hypothetical protein
MLPRIVLDNSATYKESEAHVRLIVSMARKVDALTWAHSLPA